MLKKLLIFLIFATATTQNFAQQLKADENNALISVLVTDMEDKIRKNDIIHFVGKTTGKSFQGISNKEGKFDILLPEGETYEIKIIGLGEEQDYSELEIGNDEGSYEANITIGYEPATSFTLKDVHFDVNLATLRPESFKTLNELVEILKIKEDLRVEIAGHTDSDADEKHNQKLSQNRAEEIKKYMVSKGIDAKRISTVGYGESVPKYPNDSPENKALNRRIEAKIIGN